MRALFIDKHHNVVGPPEGVFDFEVLESELPLDALTRALSVQVGQTQLSPWGQAMNAQGNELRGLVFIVGQEWADAAREGQPLWSQRELATCKDNDELWNLYCEGFLGGYSPPHRGVDIFHFGNSPSMAAQLAHLVIKGRKRLTASWLVAREEQEDTRLPPSPFSIVTDWFGTPLCLIETVRVDVIPFRDIPPEVAIEEGEGDLTFEDWQRGHRAYFESEAKEVGLEFTQDAQISIERFRLVKVFGGCM